LLTANFAIASFLSHKATVVASYASFQNGEEEHGLVFYRAKLT